MNNNYISVDAAMRAALYSGATMKILRALDAVPREENVEEVVRCSKCKHNYGLVNCSEYNPDGIVCDYWNTDGLYHYDFCSYGEALEEGENDGEL